MRIAVLISRITDYHSRHGFRGAIHRALVQFRRAIFQGRMVVFYCDLREQSSPVKSSGSVSVERLRNDAELCAADLQEMTSFWNPTQVVHNIRERFEKGASLWLVKSGGKLAGYGWTIQGRPIAPFYFPLGSADVQLFDFYVFPKFRGRGAYWLLMGHILRTLAAEGGARAYADTGEWNKPQLAAFSMTPLQRLGLARTVSIFGHQFTSWKVDGPALRAPKHSAGNHKTFKPVTSHER